MVVFCFKKTDPESHMYIHQRLLSVTTSNHCLSSKKTREDVTRDASNRCALGRERCACADMVFSAYYAGIIRYALESLLCSILCWHNLSRPTHQARCKKEKEKKEERKKVKGR